MTHSTTMVIQGQETVVGTQVVGGELDDTFLRSTRNPRTAMSRTRTTNLQIYSSVRYHRANSTPPPPLRVDSNIKICNIILILRIRNSHKRLLGDKSVGFTQIATNATNSLTVPRTYVFIVPSHVTAGVWRRHALGQENMPPYWILTNCFIFHIHPFCNHCLVFQA